MCLFDLVQAFVFLFFNSTEFSSMLKSWDIGTKSTLAFSTCISFVSDNVWCIKNHTKLSTLTCLINGHARLFISQKNSTLPSLIRNCPFIKFSKKWHPARLLSLLICKIEVSIQLAAQWCYIYPYWLLLSAQSDRYNFTIQLYLNSGIFQSLSGISWPCLFIKPAHMQNWSIFPSN